jgi:hypothetical protein
MGLNENVKFYVTIRNLKPYNLMVELILWREYELLTSF